LDYAAVWGNESIVRLLLERGAQGTQPLFEAVSNQRGDIARILLESGVPTLEDLRQSASYLRALGDDDDLIRLIRNAQRRRPK